MFRSLDESTVSPNLYNQVREFHEFPKNLDLKFQLRKASIKRISKFFNFFRAIVGESFNGKFRDECLNENWFLSLEDAPKTIESWRIDYNESRPHGSLGDLAPKEFADVTMRDDST